MSNWRDIKELTPEMSKYGRLYLRFRNGQYGPGYHNPDGSLHYHFIASIPTHFQIIDRVPEFMVRSQIDELDMSLEHEREAYRNLNTLCIPLLLRARDEFVEGIHRERTELDEEARNA